MVRQRGTAASKHEAREVDKNIEEVKAKTANKHLSRIPTKPGVSLRQRCFTFAKYALLLSILPPFLNFAALHKEGQQLKPQTGELYDIGFGQKMYLGCLGQGAPTVILDAPTGMSSDVWLQVQLKLAKFTKVCVYDRAGLGFSERPYRNESTQEGTDNDNPAQLFSKGSERWQHYTVERMADDLHRLVTGSSDQPRPFILVGAEMGALVSRFYANMFQGEVSDLVLIEPLVETIFMEDDGIWTQFWFGHLIPWQQSLQLAAATGLTRFALLLGLMEQPLAGANQTMEQIARQKYLVCNPRHMSSVVDEHHFINESFSQIRTLSRLKQFPSNISVMVINGNYYDEQLPSGLNKAWAKSQQHLISQLHPQSQHVLVNGGDHRMIYRMPQTIVEPIVRIIKKHRHNKRTTKDTKSS